MIPILISLVFASSFSSAAKPATSICTTLNQVVAKGNPSQKLKNFFAASWKYENTEFPEAATYHGYPGQNDRWSDLSLATIQRHHTENVCELKALNKIPRKALKGEDVVNFDLAKKELENEIEGAKFDGDYLVLDHLGGMHTNVSSTLDDMPKANKHDIEDMISRLDKVPELEAQTEILLREGLKRKVTPVKMHLSRVPAQFDRVLTDKIEDSPLYEPFTKMSASISKEDQADLQKRAKEVIQTRAYPALGKLREFVVTTYIPGARETISIADLPNGKEWYAFNVKMHTTTNMTPAEIHELGLKEVERITKEMADLRAQVKFKGSVEEFHKFLMKDKQFYYTNPEDLLAGYRDIAKRIDPELPRLFKTLPRLTYGVKEIPRAQAADAPGAYYQPGAVATGRPGYFTANTTDLPGRPKWGMEALTLHEAVPGHHFQIAIAGELTDVPEFRKHQMFTAFVEGWGLYAESLGTDLGLFKDPYSHYGQLSYEMWRAIRLVVDTGIHSMGWSRQQAIDYFGDHMPKAQKEVENEVDRYINWPGQALAYKVGQLKFLELKKRAKTELGDAFDIREFHDQLLKHGGLPLDVLEKNITQWIDSQKKATQSKKT